MFGSDGQAKPGFPHFADDRSLPLQVKPEKVNVDCGANVAIPLA